MQSAAVEAYPAPATPASYPGPSQPTSPPTNLNYKSYLPVVVRPCPFQFGIIDALPTHQYISNTITSQTILNTEMVTWQQYLDEFVKWTDSHGWQDKPLYLTEYGDYKNPCPYSNPNSDVFVMVWEMVMLFGVPLSGRILGHSIFTPPNISYPQTTCVGMPLGGLSLAGSGMKQ